MPTFTNFISLIPGVKDFQEKVKIALVVFIFALALGLLGGYKWGHKR